VEFVPYNEAKAWLTELGALERKDGDSIRLVLDADAVSKTRPGEIVQATIGEASDERRDERHVDAKAETLGEIAEGILHKSHLNQILLIPVGQWRSVLDLLAFSLADDEDWLDIDAEASLHQNSHDALMIQPRQRHIIPKIVNALIESGDDPSHDLTIASVESPLLVEVRPSGTLRLSCLGRDVADQLLAVVSAAP